MKESVNELKESGQLESTVYQDDDQELIFNVSRRIPLDTVS